ncbi:MAG: methionyl-tRNA synthetase, partial [Patescibacteria group bacterium]|nr:methionyl-tRNA synthetase [Patescibacteria group bacterium]
FEISRAVHVIWSEISRLDTLIQDTKPFKVIKENKQEGQKIITELVVRLYTIARMLNPILPETSTAIKNLIKQNKAPESPLFVRKD